MWLEVEKFCLETKWGSRVETMRMNHIKRMKKNQSKLKINAVVAIDNTMES